MPRVPTLYIVSTIVNIADAASSLFAFMHGAIELNYWNMLLHLGNIPSMLLAIITYQIVTTIFLLFPRRISITLLSSYTIIKVIVAIHNILLGLTI